MASCMQHLYMMPEARNSILKANCNQNAKHSQTLKELQRMFAYLLVSSLNPQNKKYVEFIKIIPDSRISMITIMIFYLVNLR